MTKGELIREIKKHKDKHGVEYKYCRVAGGRMLLESAPLGNLFGMYNSLVSRKPKEEKAVQLEFAFK
jgi:hypothetical protein